MDDDIKWDVEKDSWLKVTRGLTFLMAEEAIATNQIVDDYLHPDPARAHQRVMVFRIAGRCVGVPYVIQGKNRFLKTMYFSRNLDKKYGVLNG
jgi:hypothetical protein